MLDDLYQQIDTAIINHFDKKKKQPPCGKGCASCCSQFFEISLTEFEPIKNDILTMSCADQTALKNKSMIFISLFQENWPDFYNEFFTNPLSDYDENRYYQHPGRFNVHLPCIFLSDEGSCTIYQHRPIVCRTTGGSYIHQPSIGPICNEIRHGLLARFWQADLRFLLKDIDAIRWSTRQYPIFYLVYRHFLASTD